MGNRPKTDDNKLNTTQKISRTKHLVLLALFATIALTIFVIESAIPTLVPIPGVKLGLANVVTLYVLKRMGFKDAALVLTVRILLSTIFAGQAVSLLYSVCGGALCLLIMCLVNWFLNGHAIFLTSVFGAIAHNAGQLFAAVVILRMTGILAYAPVLLISAVITGLFTGLICYFMDRYLP